MNNKRQRDEEYISEIKRTKKSSIYSDRPLNYINIMEMPQEQRLNFINNTPNPFFWPLEYYQIYVEEMNLRNVSGFDNLLCIDNINLYKGNEKEIINPFNTNCIKSRLQEYLGDISFNSQIKDFIRDNYGIEYYNNIDEFIDGDSLFLNKQKEIDDLLEKADNKKIKLNVLGKKVTEMEESITDEMEEEMSNEIDDEIDKLSDVINDLEIKINKLDEKIEELENNFSELKDDYISSNKFDKQYTELKKLYPNKYRIIVGYINLLLDNYAKYVVIAGGFALSMYIYEHYGYEIKFNDIDLFIHSCSDKIANEIIVFLEYLTGSEIFVNDNVIFSYFVNSIGNIEYDKKINEYSRSFLMSEDKISIQIIRRLYTCPSQIIHGFDVDSCCILVTMEGNIWCTKRCAYSISNGYNVVNFLRMSPSYEFRLVKYNKRGFAIWIPFIEYYEKCVLFDINKLDKTKLSSVITRDLILKGESKGIKETSDYYKENGTKNIGRKIGIDYLITSESYDIDEFVEFKTLNPNEQIINTFHRIVLNDPIEWYPVWYPEYDILVDIENESKTDIIIVPEYTGIEKNIMSCKNIINGCIDYGNKKYTAQKIKNHIIEITKVFPDIYLAGFTSSLINGVSSNSIHFYAENSNLSNGMIKYKILQIVLSVKLLNALKSINPNINCSIEEIGKFVFLNKENEFPKNDEENFKNYQDIGVKKYFNYINILLNEDKNIKFLPSKLFLNILTTLSNEYFNNMTDEFISNCKSNIRFKLRDIIKNYFNNIYFLTELNNICGLDILPDIKNVNEYFGNKLVLDYIFNIMMSTNYYRRILYIYSNKLTLYYIDSIVNIINNKSELDKFHTMYHKGVLYSKPYYYSLTKFGLYEEYYEYQNVRFTTEEAWKEFIAN